VPWRRWVVRLPPVGRSKARGVRSETEACDGLVTGVLDGIRERRVPREPRKPERTQITEKPRVVKTIRVDADEWREFGRYVHRRQGRGEAIQIGEAVEQAIKEYREQHPA
jgi:hypothetical protein